MERRDLFRARTFARDRRIWFLTLLFAGALWIGTTAWLNRRVELAARRPAGSGDDGRFVVLAFDRILPMPEPRQHDRLGLRDRLRALARAGYQAVTLEEIRNAREGRARLPSKPVLLTFDEGYLSTYEAVDPVLRELHWPAVMFLRTTRQENRDVAFLFWDRLARMIQSGLWEIASGDPRGKTAVSEGSPVPESPPGARLIAERLGPAKTPAWAPRGVDPVAALGCAEAVRVRLAEGAPVSWLGFVDDVAGTNRFDSNPYRMARLRVDPSWSPAELVARLDRGLETPPVSSARDGRLPAAAWVAGEGTVVEAAGTIRLEGAPRAEVWIPGALWTDDWILEARLAPGTGEFWIVEPGDLPGYEWRFGGIGGVVYLQNRRPGQPPDVLMRRELPRGGGATHRVRVARRGAGVWITWDGTPVAETPLAVRGRWRGKVGVVAYGGQGRALLDVSDLRFAASPLIVRDVSASPSPDEVQRLVAEAPSIAAISPPWATVEGGVLREDSLDRDLFLILARRYAWEVLPIVAVLDTAPPDAGRSAWVSNLTDRVRAGGFAGVRFELPPPAKDAIDPWPPFLRDLERGFGLVGKRLVLSERPR